MKNIKFSVETYNLLVLLKKERSFEALLNKMANYFIKSELDVFNLRPYSEEAILKELQKIKDDQDRMIKILKAQERDYKGLFASKNDLQNITINKKSEIITIEDLQQNGMTQDELLDLIDSANSNNLELEKKNLRIEELEKKLASQADKVSNISSDNSIDNHANIDDELIQMSFSEAFKELMKYERIKPSDQREFDKDIFEKMKIILDSSVKIENEEIQEAYNLFMSTLEYFDMIKVYWTDDITTDNYIKSRNHLLSLL